MNKENIFLPISIVIAGILIGAGFYFGDNTKQNETNTNNKREPTKDLISIMRPIDANDHILGSAEARVVIVEYSDPDCPFCKMFHATMKSLMNEYGSSGKLSWVYRHYPINELHPNAFKKAEAMECAENLGGSAKFWQFADKLYESNLSKEDSVQLAELPALAKSVGLAEGQFKNCLESGEFAPRVELDISNAKEMEIIGTPYSILIDRKTGEHYPLEGAYPYAQLKQVIDLILES